MHVIFLRKGTVLPLAALRKDWYLIAIAKQPAPAPHLAHSEGCDAPRVVQVTVPRVSRSCEQFSDGFKNHLLLLPSRVSIEGFKFLVVNLPRIQEHLRAPRAPALHKTHLNGRLQGCSRFFGAAWTELWPPRKKMAGNPFIFPWPKILNGRKRLKMVHTCFSNCFLPIFFQLSVPHMAPPHSRLEP